MKRKQKNSTECQSSPSNVDRIANVQPRLLLLALVVFFTSMQSAVVFSATQSADKEAFKKDHIKSMMVKATNWQLKNPKHDIKDWAGMELFMQECMPRGKPQNRLIFMMHC